MWLWFSRQVTSDFCNPMDCSLCPWDSPGKNTGVGCHFLTLNIHSHDQPHPNSGNVSPLLLPHVIETQCRKKEKEVAQSCPTLRDPMDCSHPHSSFHGIFQARVLEWVAISFSSFQMPQEFLIVSLLTSEVDASKGREVWELKEHKKETEDRLTY